MQCRDEADAVWIASICKPAVIAVCRGERARIRGANDASARSAMNFSAMAKTGGWVMPEVAMRCRVPQTSGPGK